MEKKSGKQTKILTNRTNKNSKKQSNLTKQNNLFEPIEARALLIVLKNIEYNFAILFRPRIVTKHWKE